MEVAASCMRCFPTWSPAKSVLPQSCAVSTLRCGLLVLRRWQAEGGGLRTEVGRRRSVWCRSATEEKDYKYYEALTRGGEEVTAMMEEMVKILKDITLSEEEEAVAVKMAASAAVGQKLDDLDQSFLLALDFMISQADKDVDDKRKSLLRLMKETVLQQLAKKSPPHVQVVTLLCTTEEKEQRQDILRRSAGGGGKFPTKSGSTLLIPAASLPEIAGQADDILATMEDKGKVQDRRLLAKLVLVREEARSMLGGGLLDGRNDNRGLQSLHISEVTFLSKLIAMRPGSQCRDRLANVLRGKDEGADIEVEEKQPSLIQRPESVKEKTKKNPPVRPGLFMDTVIKVIGAMYSTNATGVTVQQLEWIHRESLAILQEMAFRP